MKKQFIEALKKDTAYDFVANEYYSFTKDELKDIILELLYGVHLAENNRIEGYEITDSVIEELSDRWDLEEEAI